MAKNTKLSDLNEWPQILTVCFLVLLSLSVPVMAQEPDEREMCGAIEAKFDAMNEQMQQTRKLCEQRAYQNDPALAMQCLAQFSASGGTGNMSVRITRCEKVACEKASNQAGYICDYITGMDMPGNVAMTGSLGAMATRGGLGQGRFIETKSGWLFISLHQ